MNKKLFAKVKDLCKDTGLSEKYLSAITEKLGGSIEDDSTDEAAITETANLVVEIAKASQGEATRWVNIKGKTDDKSDDDPDNHGDNGGDGKGKKGKKDGVPTDSPDEKRIKALEDEIAQMKAERSKGERAAQIATAMEKHGIPAKFRARLAKSISDDEDIEEAVANIKQDFITNGLMTDDSEGGKAASEKQVDEASEDLLKSLTAK